MRFVTKELITKGWSSDKKYYVTDDSGKSYLLRISDAAEFEKKKLEFNNMRLVASHGVAMCQPVDFGLCEEGVYSLQSWIDGVDAEELIPTLSAQQQYDYGLESGKQLKLIHSLPAPADMEDFAPRFNRKIDRKIKMYHDCPLKYNCGGQAFIDYINAHRHLLEGRSQCWQHGDYHIGNMMIDRDGKLQIIDFNRSDYADPWEEFNRIVWCAQVSPLFASGMVDGYFDHNIPHTFWQLLALYIASNTLSSLPWAIPFGEKEIETMQNQAAQVLGWFDGMKHPVPTWYCKP